MKNLLLAVCLLTPLQAFSAGPEALSGFSDSAFSTLKDFRFTRVNAPAVPAKPVQAAPAQPAMARYVHVSGDVRLNGTAHVPQGATYTWVNFSGWATVTDLSRKITMQPNYLNQSIGCTITGKWINCSAWPTWWVR